MSEIGDARASAIRWQDYKSGYDDGLSVGDRVGWNDAIEAAAELAEQPMQKLQRGHTVAAAIRKLRKE